MSVANFPIHSAVFAEAIQELPLSAVYGKVAELRNSVSHLHRSNAEIRLFISESSGQNDHEPEKKELERYISENEDVIKSMNERISLLKVEVENRGQVWIETEQSNTQIAERQDLSTEAETAVPATNGTRGETSARQTDNSNAGHQEDEGVYL